MPISNKGRPNSVVGLFCRCRGVMSACATGGGPSLPRNHVEEHADTQARFKRCGQKPPCSCSGQNFVHWRAGDKNCPTCKRCSVAVGGNWEKQARHGTAGHDMANSGDPLVHLSPCRLKLCPSKLLLQILNLIIMHRHVPQRQPSILI